MNNIKLGSVVLCKSYIRKSGNMFEYLKETETENGISCCRLWNKYLKEYSDEIEDYMEADRFEEVQCDWFEGIYVGTTNLCTKLLVFFEYNDFTGEEFFRFGKTKPEQFAVVYYANNRKRYVPIKDVKLIKPKEE